MLQAGRAYQENKSSAMPIMESNLAPLASAETLPGLQTTFVQANHAYRPPAIAPHLVRHHWKQPVSGLARDGVITNQDGIIIRT